VRSNSFLRPLLTLLPLALAPLAPPAFVAGCDSCSKTSAPETPAVPSVASSAPAPSAPAPSASVGASGKMAHCPDAVAGAKTAISDVPGGVELVVTGKDPAAVADVRARITALLDAQKTQSGRVRHSGNGEGGGLLGRCPVVLKDTMVTATTVDNGSKITVLARNPAEVDWLRRETRDREEDLEAAGSPAGAGKMAHCPSAILGAVTTLKNTPDGVSVTVLASPVADDVVKSIRERSRHLAEIADDAGAAVEPPHTGEGGGHGSIGRCPVVVTNTTLKVKDIPGGAQVDVKAKTAADVPKLQAEAKERAAKFQLPSPAASGSASAAPGASAAH
jgi:TusA-related sulfurtransferase